MHAPIETAAPGEITRLLKAVQSGDRAAESRLMNIVYPDLLRLADVRMNRENQGHTLQASALVNEAYLHLLRGAKIKWRDRVHFFATAALCMRRILTDYGRAKRAAKREGNRHKVELVDNIAISEDRLDEILSVDEALTKLAKHDPRQVRIVELRYFGGLTDKEVAEALDISSRTVQREWEFARTWLSAEMAGAGERAAEDSGSRPLK